MVKVAQFPVSRLYVQVGTVKLGPIRAFLRVFGPVRGSKLGAAQVALAGWLELDRVSLPRAHFGHNPEPYLRLWYGIHQEATGHDLPWLFAI